MNSHLTNHIAREHVNDMIATAEHDRLVREARAAVRRPRLIGLVTAARRRQPTAARAAPAACRTPARP